jgi:poly(3-hydroxybutyrate) depolymerase
MNRSRTLRLLLRAAIGAAIASLAAYTCASLFWQRVERRNETVSVDGMTRDYLLVVPPCHGAEAIPLVVALHGTGDSPNAMEEYSGLSNLASQNGFVVVYPSAIRGMWNVMDAGPADNNRDIRFIDALIAKLTSQHNLDSRRIYVVGMSNGASFAQLWAAHRSHRIAAVAAHSGPPIGDAVSDQPFPVMLIVGSKDGQTVEAVQNAARNYRQASHPVELIVVEHLGHEWDKSKTALIWEFLSRHRLEELQ